MDPNDVSAVMKKAVEITKGLPLDEGWGPVALAKSVDLLVDGAKPVAATPPATNNGHTPDPGDALGKIAQKLSIDVDVVERVFDFHDGEVQLVIDPNRLPAGKSPATADIALLISAGRQAVGLDENGTDIDVVRIVAEHFKRYDSANYSTTINGLRRVMTIRGSGRDRLLKMTSPAWSQASSRVRELMEA